MVAAQTAPRAALGAARRLPARGSAPGGERAGGRHTDGEREGQELRSQLKAKTEAKEVWQETQIAVLKKKLGFVEAEEGEARTPHVFAGDEGEQPLEFRHPPAAGERRDGQGSLAVVADKGKFKLNCNLKFEATFEFNFKYN